MKKYYTLVQDYIPSHRSLEGFLDEQGIDYSLGADFPEDLRKFGFTCPSSKTGTLVKTYKVLIDDHELSAIKLSIDGVTVIENRDSVKLQNKIRGMFSWILD